MCMNTKEFRVAKEPVRAFRLHLISKKHLTEHSVYYNDAGQTQCKRLITELCYTDREGNDFFRKDSEAGWHVMLSFEGAVNAMADTIVRHSGPPSRIDDSIDLAIAENPGLKLKTSLIQKDPFRGYSFVSETVLIEMILRETEGVFHLLPYKPEDFMDDFECFFIIRPVTIPKGADYAVGIVAPHTFGQGYPCARTARLEFTSPKEEIAPCV